MEGGFVLKLRNGLLISFAILALLVMWANVIGLAGALSVIVHIILVLNIAGLVYAIAVTGLESLTTSKMALMVIGLLVVATFVRFFYAMAKGD